MPDDIQRILGRLETGIENLAEQQRLNRVENNNAHEVIFKEIKTIAMDGSAISKQNAKDITDLQKRPERVVGFAATIIAIASAIWSTFMSRGGHP